MADGGFVVDDVSEVEREFTQGALRQVADSVRSAFPRASETCELVLIDVDPRHVHAFWNVPPATATELRAALGFADDDAPLVLRLTEVTPQDEPGDVFDIEVVGLQGQFYVDIWGDARRYRGTLGFRLRDGSLAPLAQSNEVSLPPGASAADTTWREIAMPAPPPPPARPALTLAASTTVPSAFVPTTAAGHSAPLPMSEPAAGAVPAAVAATVLAVAPTAEGTPPAPAAAPAGPAPTPLVGVAAGEATSLVDTPPPAEVAFAAGPPEPPPSTPSPFAEATSGVDSHALPAPPALEGSPDAAGDAAAVVIANALAAHEREAVLPLAPFPFYEPESEAPSGEPPATEAGESPPPPDSGESEGPPPPSPDEGPEPVPLPLENVLTLSSFAVAGSEVEFEVNAELHIFGRAKPGLKLQMFGRPVAVRPDGTFSINRPLPNGALVLSVLLAKNGERED